MPSLRNSGQNTFFPKQAKLSESFSCTYSFQILCLEFQTPVFGIPNIRHSCVFGIPNMCVWNSKHVVFCARFARAQIPNVQSFRDVYMAITLWENTRDRLTPTRLYSSEYGSLLNFVETPFF